LLIHFVFGYNWFISILVALSFATVGEGILIPILDEFKLIKTKIGQSILGIGTLDDIIEVFVVISAILAVPIMLGKEKLNLVKGEILTILLTLVALFIFTFLIIKSKKERITLGKIRWVEMVFLFTLAILFLFVGLGQIAEAAAIGALLAGISVKNILPKEKLLTIESEIKGLAYGFFGPIFFFWVGMDTNVSYLIYHPLLVVLVIIITYSAKVLGSYLIGKKELNKKPSILMGIALGVRFSTSIVIVKYLFEKTLIGLDLYSVLVASTIASFAIPFLFSFFLRRWKIRQ
jgi:Ca2+-transporting ATPase